MIRKYTPYYRWNAFDDDDIKDIDGVIEFARGLVIKDSDYADSLETETSLKASDLYMRANDNTLDPSYSEFQPALTGLKLSRASQQHFRAIYLCPCPSQETFYRLSPSQGTFYHRFCCFCPSQGIFC